MTSSIPDSEIASALPRRHASRLSDYVTLCLLTVYVASAIVFRLSTLQMTYPTFDWASMVTAVDCVLGGLLFVSLLLIKHQESGGMAALVASSVAVLLLSALLCGDFALARGYLILLAVRKTDIRKLCRAYYRTILATLSVITLLAVFGILYNRDAVHDGMLVFPYGLTNTNIFGAVAFSAVGAVAYDVWHSRRWPLATALALTCATFSYVAEASDAAAIMLCLLAVAICIGHVPAARHISLPNVVRRGLLVGVPLALCIYMLAMTALYHEPSRQIGFANRILHGRPFYAHRYFVANGGFSLFGKPYTYEASYHNGLGFQHLDSAYCFLPMVYGLVVTVAVAANYLASFHLGSWDAYTAFLALAFSVYAVAEVHPMYPYADWAMFALSNAHFCCRVHTPPHTYGRENRCSTNTGYLVKGET